MRFTVRHETIYRYAAPVRLTPHWLRFAPRPDGVRLFSRELTIEPAPTYRRETTDAFGNLVTQAMFEGFPIVSGSRAGSSWKRSPPHPPTASSRGNCLGPARLVIQTPPFSPPAPST